MFQNLLNKIKFFKKNYFVSSLYFLDSNEKYFIKSVGTRFFKKALNKKKILVSLQTEYFFLIYYHLLMKEKKFHNYEFIGIWTNHHLCSNNSFGLITFIFDSVKNYFFYLKWKKLYTAVGISKFIYLQSINPISLLLSYQRSKKNLKMQDKKKLLKLKLNGIVIGDLFYDTYLRFYRQATIDLKDKFKLNFLHSQFYLAEKKLNFIFQKNQIQYLLSGFSSFLQHGLAVRFFLKKKIEVYGGKNFTQLIKKFSNSNNTHLENWNLYKKKFDRMNNKIKKRKLAKKILTNRVSGKMTDHFMKKSSFYGRVQKKLSYNHKKIDCIIFLPDFTDSPHIKGPMLFNDYEHWIIETLKFLNNYRDYKIAIKPHPNSQYSGKILIERLKKDFNKKNFLWLNSNCSNKYIYKKKPYFGISPAGTSLIEMPFMSVIPLSAGRHPFFKFKLGVNPKSINDYFKNLSLLMSKKIPLNVIKKEHIFDAFYMQYLNKNDAFKNDIKNFDIYKYFKNRDNSSTVLKKFSLEIN